MRFFTRDPSDKIPASRPAKVRDDTSPIASGSGWEEAQQALGNQGIQRLLRSSSKKQGLQPGLRVGAPGDAYEREADRVADQVSAKPANLDVSSAPPRIQRFSEPASLPADAAPPSVSRVVASPGSPLEPGIRQDMEERFGQNFSRVRVHTDTAAQQSALDLGARAYTVGHSIVFDSGRFAPATREGRRLIAHELAHVVQQSQAPAAADHTVQRSPDEPQPGGAQTMPSARKGARKVPFSISFNTPLTRSEFIELAETTIFGQLLHLQWTGVRDHYNPSDSPRTVTVPESLVRSVSAARIEALPGHIQKFLTTGEGPVASAEELRSLAEAGAVLEGAGVTEEELLLREAQRAEAESYGLPQQEGSDSVAWAEEYVAQRQEGAEKALQNRQAIVGLRSKVDAWSQDDKNGIKNVAEGIVEERVMHSILHRHGMSYSSLVAAFEFELRSITQAFLSQGQLALFRIERTYLAGRNVGLEKEALSKAIERIRPTMARRDRVARKRDLRKDKATAYGLLPFLASSDPKVQEAEAEVKKMDEDLQKESASAGLPVVSWKGFDWDAIRGGDIENSRSTLRQFVSHAYSQIRSAQRKVTSLKTLYKADRMVEMAKAAVGIEKGSVYDDIISFRAKSETSDDGFWSTLWDIVSIALMFVPGNIGVLLRVGAGIVNTTKAMDEYAEGMGMSQVGLASDPSSLGVFLAAGGTLLDAHQMAKGVVKVLDVEAGAGAKFGSRASKSAESTVAHEAEGTVVKASDDVAERQAAKAGAGESKVPPRVEPSPKEDIRGVIADPADPVVIEIRGKPPAPASPNITQAQQRVADANASLTATRLDTEAAKKKVLNADADLATAKELANEPGGKALVAETQSTLDDARRELSELQRSLDLAETQAKNAARAGGSVERLEQEIAEIDSSINAIYRRNRGRAPAMGSEDGVTLRNLKNQKQKYAEELAEEIDNLTSDWIRKLRQGTPGPDAVDRAVQNLSDLPKELRVGGQPLDITAPGGGPLTRVSPDHIHPVDKIVREPGFGRLKPSQQREVLELRENYLPMTLEANQSKGNLTMEEWFRTDIGSRVPETLRKPLIEAEKRAQKAVRDYIDRHLAL